MESHAYNFTLKELADVLEDTLRRATAEARLEYLFPFESLLCLAGITISDSGDSRLCSRAMQVLRKRGLIIYRRRYGQWQNNLWKAT